MYAFISMYAIELAHRGRVRGLVLRIASFSGARTCNIVILLSKSKIERKNACFLWDYSTRYLGLR